VRKYARQLWRSLSVRLAVLVVTTFATSVIGLIVASLLFHRVLAPPTTPYWAHAVRNVLTLIVFVGMPACIIWLASRLVTRPLKNFDNAIQKLQANNYKVKLQSANITEFDRVFASFNELIRRLGVEEELRKDLISDTSHEFNTPLTALIGQLAAIEEGKVTFDKDRARLLRGQAERLAELVGQLDAYTRARTPNSEAKETFALKDICEEIVRSNELALKDKRIDVTLNIAGNVTVTAHRKAVQQIVENLVQNALRYSNARILTINGNAHKLIIEDNGIGVPTESLPHLFERFYRVDKSRNRETGGLGLGLSIVKELVLQQGWGITAKSAQPGLALIITFGS